MLPEHKAFHHTITQIEAEKRLKRKGDCCCYLTRYSRTNECYILSVYQSRPTSTMKHFKIEKDGNGKYKIKRKELIFDTIEELLEHYENNSIDPALKNIGKKYTEDEYMESQCCCIIL